MSLFSFHITTLNHGLPFAHQMLEEISNMAYLLHFPGKGLLTRILIPFQKLLHLLEPQDMIKNKD